MKVRDVIKQLLDHNLDAEIGVIVHNKKEEFTLSFGGGDGATKESAGEVSFYVDSLNNQEAAKTPPTDDKIERCVRDCVYPNIGGGNCVNCGQPNIIKAT